jgi:heterotetrameric sarcosine oxidase beta subunit
MTRRFSALRLVLDAVRGGSASCEALWPRRSPSGPYDVIIVGGGGHGLATAYYLAREFKLRRVAVLERTLVGYGNVGRNTTIVRSNYLLPQNQRFYEDSLKRWGTLARELNFNIMYSRRGVLDLAVADEELVALRRRGNAMRLSGIDAQLLDRAAVARFVPQLDVEAPRQFPILGGLLQRRGGTVRHDAVAWGYARAAAALGVDIIERCEVLGLARRAGRIVGVESDRGFIAGERVALAVAGRTASLAARLGLALPLETHLLQAGVTEPVKPMLDTVLIYMYPGAGEVYVSQSDRGGLVFGGMLDGHPSMTQSGGLSRVRDVSRALTALLPQAADLSLLRHWAGMNDMTMDGSPLIDKLGSEELFLNGGWCYGGFKAIPASGHAFAQLIARGEAPELIRPFRLSRFLTGHVLDEKGAGPFPARQ